MLISKVFAILVSLASIPLPFYKKNFFSGLVVPDVPLEETEILRKEALKNKIELVSFSKQFFYSSPR